MKKSWMKIKIHVSPKVNQSCICRDKMKLQGMEDTLEREKG